MAANDNVIKYDEAVAKLNTTLRENLNVLDSVADVLGNVNAEYKNIPSKFLQTQKEAADATVKQARAEKELQNALISTEKAKQAEINTEIKSIQLKKTSIDLKSKEAREIAKLQKETAKQAAEEMKLANVYDIIQKKINNLSSEYNNLAARKERGISLSKEEERRLAFLTGKLIGYENTLKRVDAGRGKFGREVGNYSKATENLNRSFTTFATEIPNFFQSIEIGVRSISNNIQPIRDGFKGVRQEAKEMGKEAPSALSLIANSLFSLQTLLFVGIGLLSAYSGEITEWVKNLWNGKSALDELYKAQNDFNDARLKSSGRTTQEIENIKEYIKIAKNASGSFTPEQQLAAFQIVRAAAKGYFDELQDGELLTEKGAKALDKFTKALEAQGRAEDLLSANRGTKDRINQLQAEIDARQKYLKDQKDLIKLLETNQIKEEEFVKRRKILEDSEEYRRKIRDEKDDATLSGGEDQKLGVGSGNFLAEFQDIENINIALKKLRGEEKKQRSEINEELEDAVVLEGKLKTAQGAGAKDPWAAVLAARMRYLEALISAGKQEFEVQKQLKEKSISDLEEQAKNEKNTFDFRIEAYAKYLQERQELIYGVLAFERAQTEDSRTKELTEAEKAHRSELKQAEGNQQAVNKINEYYANERVQINKKYDDENNFNQEQAGQQAVKVAEETSAAQQEIINKRLALVNETDKNYRDQQIKINKEVSENEKVTLDARQNAFREYMKLRQKQIDLDYIAALAAAGTDQAARDKVISDFKEIQRLFDKEKDEQSPFVKQLEASNKELRNMADTLRSGIFSDLKLPSLSKFFDFDEKGKSSFDKILEGFDEIKEKGARTAKQLAFVFKATTDVLLEGLSILNDAEQARFEGQLERNAAAADNARAFAGDSQEAIAEINRQEEEREKQIKNQAAQAQKRFAIFQSIITGTQATLAAYASQLVPGDPTSLPRAFSAAAVTAAFAAVKTALIVATDVPTFFTGTENAPEGWAWTQERGRELIFDKNKNLKSIGSDGGAKLTMMASGDKVLNATQSKNKLDEILKDSGIMWSAPLSAKQQDGGMSEEAMTRAVIAGLASQSQGDSYTFVDDARGRKLYQTKQNRTTELVNNKKNFTAKRIGR